MTYRKNAKRGMGPPNPRAVLQSQLVLCLSLANAFFILLPKMAEGYKYGR